ncbi:VOC family protein [Peribacillus butanolivorans]
MTAITHISFSVPDTDTSIKWYEQVLEFKLIAGSF